MLNFEWAGRFSLSGIGFHWLQPHPSLSKKSSGIRTEFCQGMHFAFPGPVRHSYMYLVWYHLFIPLKKFTRIYLRWSWCCVGSWNKSLADIAAESVSGGPGWTMPKTVWGFSDRRLLPHPARPSWRYRDYREYHALRGHERAKDLWRDLSLPQKPSSDSSLDLIPPAILLTLWTLLRYIPIDCGRKEEVLTKMAMETPYNASHIQYNGNYFNASLMKEWNYSTSHL